MGLSRCLTLPILAFLVLLLSNYYIVVVLALQPWIGVPALLHALLFTLLNVMILISHGLAVLRDPGQVPANYSPDLETDQSTVSKGKERRFCEKCGLYKPARAHHCRICKRCILRMDHHCSWLNNCVGHRNYKAFLLLVFYLFLGCSYSLAIFGGSTLNNSSTYQFWKVMYGVCLVVGVLIFGSMQAWYAYLLVQNKTTIEFHQGKREGWIAVKAGQIYRHPYDLGLLANLINVLGPKTKYWLCPMSVGHIGSGLWSRTLSETHINNILADSS
ncbi:hypothetical protein SELMODRAFT_448518 [Selaginella moellendorffii]|uniref:S-acyltransferase n=1 Tax=Selaginella moellendorffii TaxID=88036 RepID=D8T7W5_SELML|nr:probable protein S-acyltransferase 16 [Selaginella moellendorffii]EFJ07273.1 hypothetical protein SELMODRAFT_448518 [Selaginella moellendorffii]|eukprot:XP_002991702.1 probable protein S-acyltransferase 16 [Selaginella moellendorffii]